MAHILIATLQGPRSWVFCFREKNILRIFRPYMAVADIQMYWSCNVAKFCCPIIRSLHVRFEFKWQRSCCCDSTVLNVLPTVMGLSLIRPTGETGDRTCDTLFTRRVIYPLHHKGSCFLKMLTGGQIIDEQTDASSIRIPLKEAAKMGLV